MYTSLVYFCRRIHYPMTTRLTTRTPKHYRWFLFIVLFFLYLDYFHGCFAPHELAKTEQHDDTRVRVSASDKLIMYKQERIREFAASYKPQPK